MEARSGENAEHDKGYGRALCALAHARHARIHLELPRPIPIATAHTAGALDEARVCSTPRRRSLHEPQRGVRATPVAGTNTELPPPIQEAGDWAHRLQQWISTMRTSRDLASQPLALAASDRTDARWYGVHSQPHGEETALRHLQRQGFTAFLPRRLRTIRHARRVTTGTEAYFPRYLFIALDLRRDRWRMVNGTVGVDQLLSACDRPLPFRRGVVEALMAATGPDGVLRPSAVFKPGQKVRVSYGAFAEEIGMLEAVTSSGAIRVLLNMMDRQVSVQLSRDAIGVIP